MNPEAEDQLKKTIGRWNTTATERAANPIQGWMDSPIVLEVCVLPKLGGGPGRHWLLAAVERHMIPRNGNWLSLGCGTAGTEIAAARWGLFASMLALDASSSSLEIASDAAAEQGINNIRFDQANLDSIKLPIAHFDVVLMNMSLHHVKELGHVLSEVSRALDPGGWFIANEFVGPRQFQFTDLQLSIVRELLASLPTRYRMDQTTGRVKTEIKKRFSVVEHIDYGGTVLNLLLEHIVHNFDSSDERDRALIALLGRIEDILIRNRVLPSDFTLLTMKKRRGFFPRAIEAIRR
jgi:ubiquinone/menaquinone biosynthesis C-methylase UbiE